MDAGTLRLLTDDDRLPIKLYPGKLKWSAIAVLSAVVAAAGWKATGKELLFGWLLVILGGASFGWALMQVAEYGAYLLIAREHFTLRTIMGEKTYAWADVEKVTVPEVIGEEDEPHVRLQFRDGTHKNIHQDFGMSPEDLAQVLRRSAALSTPPHSPR
jgi:hypothetical protein